jgi:hypothetical protein
MKETQKFSQSEMVLLATYRASKSFGTRVPYEEIVLQVWKDFPETFSLNNHPEYPDSHPVIRRLSSDLLTNRLVVSLRKQVYRLTEKGVEAAKELDTQSTVKNKDKLKNKKSISQVVHLNREQEDFLQYAIRSRAFSTWKQGKGEDLIDYDARMFFQFSTGTPVKERKRKVENAREAIEKAVSLGTNDSTELNDLFMFLTSKFSQLFEEG